MSNVSWGTKRSCPKCASRFYDLDKHPATCPKCNTSFDPAAMLKPRRGRARKFSNLGSEENAEDAMLTSILAKANSSKAASKKAAAEEDDDLKDDGLVEDAEEIEDIDSIEELEAVEEETPDEADEEAIMEGFEADGLVDEIEDEEEVEDEEEEKPAPKRKR